MLGFQRRFEPFVRDGTKQHTIRALRKGKRQIKPGDRLDCYGDSRQKTMHLLGRFPCTGVRKIVITYSGDVSIDGLPLCDDEKDSLAWQDGFRHAKGWGHRACFELMLRYWRLNRMKGKRKWTGVIIHWKYEKGMVAAA